MQNSLFIQPNDSEETAKTVSTLHMNISSDTNNIPYKILNLLKKDISKQLADVFNL